MESCASAIVPAAGSVDELRMSCERSSGFRSDALSLYSIWASTASTVSSSLLGYLLSSTVLQWQPWVGYFALTIRSVRLGLNVQTFRLAIHLNLFRGDSAVLCGIVEGHCVHLVHLLIQTLLFSLIELQGKNI